MSAGQAIAFTGGGSGGHVFPGLAVIESLRKGFQGRIVWLGSSKESDRRAVEAAGVEYFAIPSGKLRRQPSLENLADALRVVAGYATSKRLLRTIRPVLLFSKGGYVSVPPCAAAASLGIPVLTHESDYSPGLATRLNARRAEGILVAYEATRALFPEPVRGRVSVVGNPIRSSILHGDAERGRRSLGFDGTLPLVLVLGGSQGARQVNEIVEAALPELLERAFVVHQTGEAHSGAAPSSLARPERYRSRPFIREELADIMAAATLLVSRAGANSVWEAGALGKPMILVPLAGPATRGDQVDNARHFEALGAAGVLIGQAASPAGLMRAISAWLDDPEAAARSAGAARAIAKTDAADRIASLILERIGARR